ncbi:hypothetical protein D3C75_935870 [compost metagenome]
MTETFIEQLEAIQVDMQQCQVTPALAHTLAGFMQTLLEQRTIGQARQFVIVSQVAHALFCFAPYRKIGAEADDLPQLAS